MEADFHSLFDAESTLGRLMQLEKMEEEKNQSEEKPLRPLTFADYFGQEQVKQNLQIFIKSAKERNEPLDHVLLYGPPGLGKTTIAGIIAKELGVNLRITSGPAIEKAGDLAALLSHLEPRDVLFIDEIHRLNRNVEEILYPAMEDRVLDILIGKGPSARNVRLDLAPFTLIGATTRAGSLSAPLRDRFGIINRLELYQPEELASILKRDAELLNFKISSDALAILAKSSRGTPRIAIRLLKRMRDFLWVNKKEVLEADLCQKALASLGVDEKGLDNKDRHLLTQIITHYKGGPVGLDTIVALTGEDKITIEDMIEPYLLASGFLQKTPRGRKVTDTAYAHLGLIKNKQVK